MKMDFEKSRWRLLITPPARGAWNMAVDEAILESVTGGSSLPTLRLFYWEPPCVSLGISQTHKDLELDTIKQNGWDLVRRPTGGKAILHTNELTYSVIAPLDDPRVKGSILESYCSIAGVLLGALQELGANAHADSLTKNDQGATQQPVCFETPSNYEITVNGKKIWGSAQMRRSTVMLQHGSLPLSGDLTLINNAFRWESIQAHLNANERLLSHATTLKNVLGRNPSPGTIQKSIIASFETNWNISFSAEELTEKESTRIQPLMTDKYSNAEWTFRV